MKGAESVLGLAYRAGKVEAGEEPCGAACRARWAKIVVVASDAAENTVRRAAHFAESGNCPVIHVPFSKDSLGDATGRSSCAILALCDTGFAVLLLEKLSDDEPDKYCEMLDLMKTKNAKEARRKLEKKKHNQKK